MQIEITGHHVEITEALRARIGKRLDKINAHCRPPQPHILAVLSVSKNRHMCDLTARRNGEEFVVRSDGADMYAAIDRAAEKMERRLQSAKGRERARRNQ